MTSNAARLRCLLLFVFACASSTVACKRDVPPAPRPVARVCPTCVTVDEKGFTPSSIEIPKGEPGSKVALSFTRTTDDTCATRVEFPGIALKKDLPLGTPVTIDVPTDSARTLTFQCGMAMYKSSVVVR